MADFGMNPITVSPRATKAPKGTVRVTTPVTRSFSEWVRCKRCPFVVVDLARRERVRPLSDVVFLDDTGSRHRVALDEGAFS